MSQIQITKEEEKCPICQIAGTIQLVEILPSGAFFIKCVHNDRMEHSWAEHHGIDRRRKKDPKKIRCPKCNRMGIVNSWEPNKRRPWLINYYVRHGKITYGKGNSRQQDRCMITDKEHRDKILKKLGRYIK